MTEATQPELPAPTPAPKPPKATKTAAPSKEPEVGSTTDEGDATKVYLGNGIFSLDY